MGELPAARKILEQALSGAAGLDHFAAAIVYTYLGLVSEAAGDAGAARNHFDEAWRGLDALGMPGSGQDALAGLARSSILVGDAGQALEYAGRVWEYLGQHGSQGLEFPVLGYYTCVQVFSTLGDTGREAEAIQQGYQEMLARAEKISDPAWQKAFLENIPEHRAIARSWAQLTSA
jgi:hypothetical protein